MRRPRESSIPFDLGPTEPTRCQPTDRGSPLVMSADKFAGVPEIVRMNFKALHDVVTAHGEALKSIEKAVANKIGRPEHTASLQEKVSVNEAGLRTELNFWTRAAA